MFDGVNISFTVFFEETTSNNFFNGFKDNLLQKIPCTCTSCPNGCNHETTMSLFDNQKFMQYLVGVGFEYMFGNRTWAQSFGYGLAYPISNSVAQAVTTMILRIPGLTNLINVVPTILPELSPSNIVLYLIEFALGGVTNFYILQKRNGPTQMWWDSAYYPLADIISRFLSNGLGVGNLVNTESSV